jgi:hypothetical protein
MKNKFKQLHQYQQNEREREKKKTTSRLKSSNTKKMTIYGVRYMYIHT